MRTTLKDDKYLDAIMEEKMLLISEVNPLRNLSRMEATSHFMNRNKYIYATANYTIVVKSAIGSKSGTWAGAAEALKRKIGKVFVRDIDYDGNQDLCFCQLKSGSFLSWLKSSIFSDIIPYNKYI